MTLDLITRERVIYSGPAEAIVLPAAEGEMGVLAGHADFIVMLSKGPLRARTGGGTRTFQIEGGFAEISHDRVIVLPNKVLPSVVSQGGSGGQAPQ